MQRFETIADPPASYKKALAVYLAYRKAKYRTYRKGIRSIWSQMPKDLKRDWRKLMAFVRGTAADGQRGAAEDSAFYNMNNHEEPGQYNQWCREFSEHMHQAACDLAKVKHRPLSASAKRKLAKIAAQKKKSKAA